MKSTKYCCYLIGVLLLVAATSASDKPNFIIIMADDLGYGDLSCYDGWIETPHIDALAREGLTFTDYHSNGAVCSPTRAALLTGRYQQRAGIPGVVFADPKRPQHVHGLQPIENTFAEVLKSAGYKTGIFGKWHLGYRKKYNPVRHGFDRFRGYVSGNVDFISHIDQAGAEDWWHDDELVKEEGYVTHLITKHALAFIDQHKDQPFCLYLPHEAPHYPYQGPNDKADRTPGGRFNNHGSRKDKKEAYREMVEEMDKSVGAVIAKLKEHKLENNTLVIFVSDNGATPLGSNGKFRGRKGQIWEGGHRVPAIAWWPGTIVAGATTNELALGMDLMPTMLTLAGVEAPADRPLDGVNLAPVLFKGASLGSRKAFWGIGGSTTAMRDGRWKLVQTKGWSLYDLNNDPGETTDLAEKHPERVEEMKAAMTAWRKNVAETATPQPAE